MTMLNGSPGLGLARFAADLPEVTQFVTLGEGNTALLDLPRLSERIGVRVHGKLEHVNPTGSYKDRIAAMSVSLATERGHAGWIATSSGNAGLAMSAYGRRAGLPGCLCVVASAPLEKRVPLVPYDVGLLGVEDIGAGGSSNAADRLFDAVVAAALRHSLFVGITAHAFNPEGMRGADTIGYELSEQVPAASHVYMPTGAGGLLAAVARGLAHRGMPARVVACQPEGCAPIVRFLEGEIAEPVITVCHTNISALQLPHPPDGVLAAEAVLASGGWATAVPDEEIAQAQQLLVSTEGIFVEPAAATALAALILDVQRGRIRKNDEPVLVLTGAGWKDLGPFIAASEQIRRLDVELVPGAIDEWALSLSRQGAPAGGGPGIAQAKDQP